MPGLYLIETDAKGERTFYYWRDTSPARELFELPNWAAIAEALLSARLVDPPGVTLSLYSNPGLGRFLAALELARKQGVIVAFDGIFRPRGWKGHVARTRTVFTEALKRVDIALPTFEDEATLWGDANPEATVARLQAFLHRRDRGEERLGKRAGRRQIRARICAGAAGGRAGRHHGGGGFGRTPRIWRRGSMARTRWRPRQAPRMRSRAEKIRHRGAIMPRAARRCTHEGRPTTLAVHAAMNGSGSETAARTHTA